ncbi:hypothetical protein [Jiangella rhizosphaerae]|uniref:hypothetical protein n=1 Tax=Jiangella rhizosphaerae TaxID=2293569 RepID=UPI0013144469|nr:hypothetical protein [Jiangella rhizosphaerae]
MAVLIDGARLEHLLAEHLGLWVTIGPLERPIPRQPRTVGRRRGAGMNPASL